MTSDSADTPGDAVVKTDRDGYVGIVTLNRPDAMNTFNSALATELDRALRSLDDEDGVRAVVIRGAGDAFSAGIDLSEYDADDDGEAYERWVARMEQPFKTLRAMSTPVIAAAHGHAAANGIGLVAACDLAVAAEGTQLGATAPKVGLFCLGPAVPLLEAVTRKRCLELLLTGELIDATTAAEWGLINRVAPQGQHVEVSVSLAETIAAKSPVAIAMGKRAVDEMHEMAYDEAIDHSNARFGELCATDSARDGIAAFLAGEPLEADEWPIDD